MIADKPVLGVGANNFALLINNYTTSEFAGEWLYVVHNKYLLIWAEAGIAGLLTFIWFLFATFGRGWRCWKLNDPILSPLSLGLALAVLGIMIHMLVDTFNSRSDIQLLWLVAGLISATYAMSLEENSIHGE
jgi:O-antigen ligase